MRSRLIAAVLAVVALAALAGTVAEDARAYTGPAPWTDTANWSAFRAVVTGATDASALSPGAASALTEAQIAAGAAPALGTLGVITLGASALATGYAIGTLLDHHFGISCAITACGSTSTSGIDGSYTTTLKRWNYVATDTTNSCPGDTAPCWVMLFNMSNGVGDIDVLANGYSSDLSARAAVTAAALTVGAWHTRTGSPSGPTGCGVECEVYSATVAEMAAAVAQSPVQYCSGCSYDVGRSDITQSSDPGFSTGGGAPGASLSAQSTDVQVEVGQLVDPTWDGFPPEEFEMPDCEGLTYAACLALLEAEGFVGSIVTNTLGIDDAVLALGGGNVVTTDPAAGYGSVGLEDEVTFNENPDPLPLELQAAIANETTVEYLERMGITGDGYAITYTELPAELGDPLRGPDAPVRVTIPKPGGGTRKVPVPYPGDSPAPERVEPPNEETPVEITVEVNPPGMPPVGGGGGCDPWLSADPDFGPVTDIDWGDKFPFGIFAWAGTLLDTLTTSAVAPGWSHPMPDVGTHPVPDYAWDLDFFDSYMSIWRTMLAWVMWVGALWYLGTSMLGFRTGGNPGDAVDDVL